MAELDTAWAEELRRGSHDECDPANTDFAGGNARLSDDFQYRYYLTRYWGKIVDPTERVCWVMLNPSTADALKDDTTIRRCRRYSKEWGYSGLVVVNVFAYRSADPKQLALAVDPVGPQNDEWLRHWPRQSGLVVAAWGGSYPKSRQDRVDEVKEYLRQHDPHVLGLTKDGHPLHPARLLASLRPMEWEY